MTERLHHKNSLEELYGAGGGGGGNGDGGGVLFAIVLNFTATLSFLVFY